MANKAKPRRPKTPAFRKMLRDSFDSAAVDKFSKDAAHRYVLEGNRVSTSFPSRSSALEKIKIIAVNASRPIPIDHLAPELDQFVSHRGDTIFGEAGKYIDQIAQNNNLWWWISETGLTVASIEPELALSRFDTLAGGLMAKHFREGWLGNGSLEIIAKDLDDAGLSLRDSLEPSFRKKIGLANQHRPSQAIKTFQGAVNDQRLGRRALLRSLYRAKDRYLKSQKI